MTVDPANPMVGDVFRGTRYGFKAEVRFVDDDGTVLYRYLNPAPTCVTSAALTSAEFVAAFEAVPEPLITEPIALYLQGTIWHHGYDAHSRRFRDVPYITILPDGTWHEGLLS